MKGTIIRTVAAAGLVTLAGMAQAEGIDLSKVCEVRTSAPAEARAACEPGQRITLLPGSFARGAGPAQFASASCDHRYEIFEMNSRVSCIYRPAGGQ